MNSRTPNGEPCGSVDFLFWYASHTLGNDRVQGKNKRFALKPLLKFNFIIIHHI